MLNRHGKSTDENGIVITGMLWKAFSRQRTPLKSARRWIQNVADDRKMEEGNLHKQKMWRLLLMPLSGQELT